MISIINELVDHVMKGFAVENKLHSARIADRYRKELLEGKISARQFQAMGHPLAKKNKARRVLPAAEANVAQKWSRLRHIYFARKPYVLSDNTRIRGRAVGAGAGGPTRKRKTRRSAPDMQAFVPNLPINKQTGRLADSVEVDVSVRGRPVEIRFSDSATNQRGDPYWKFLMAKSGTRYMVPRGLDSATAKFAREEAKIIARKFRPKGFS